MLQLRPYSTNDLEALYAISLATAAAGRDAAHLYRDGRLMGAIYSAPYAVLAPDRVLVAADEQGVGGFVAGAFDTEAWQDRLERCWWPELRRQYPMPDPGSRREWNIDQRRIDMIHHPERTPPQVARDFPAHVHLNLVPRLQGRGIGRRLLLEWLSLARPHGVLAVHAGVNRANARAVAFWAAMGFRTVTPPELVSGRTVWMGRS
jgi:GNAT superfamily N-acetyltransferase